MSSTIAQPSVMKSMNGVVTYDDGQGTVISNGVVSTQTLNVVNLNTQNIVAPDPALDSSLYVDDISDVYIANNCANLYLRTLEMTTFYLPTYGFTEFIQATDGTRATALFTNSSNTIFLGTPSSPIVSPYVCVNNDELANKGYVDSVVVSGGGASLTATQTFTGVNTFDNDTVIGKDDYTSTISIRALVFNIATNEMICQALDNSLFIQPYCKFTSSDLTQNMILDTGVSGKIIQYYSTNTAATSVITGRIMLEGGDATDYSGDMTIDAKNLNLNNQTITYDAGTASSVTWLFKIAGIATSYMNFSSGSASYNGVMTCITGSYGIACQTLISMTSPITTFENTLLDTNLDINTETAGEIALNYRTNTASSTVVTSSIVGSGGTTTNSGDIAINAGSLTLNAPIVGDTVTFDSGALTTINLYFKILGVATSLLQFSGGTTTYNGVASFLTGTFSAACSVLIQLKSNLSTFTNSADTTALDVDIGVAGTLGLEFRTNTAVPTRITSSIEATGNTAALAGTMTLTNGILNLNSSVGTDFNNNRVRLIGTSTLYGDADGTGNYLPLFAGNCFTLVTAAVTLTMRDVTRESMYVIPFGTTTSFTITLSTTNSRDSATFHIMNNGTGTITVGAGGGGRMFGNGYTLGGQNTVTLASGVGRSFRCCQKTGGVGISSGLTIAWYVH